MDLYVFSSKNLTNIWAGIGAGLWAIPPSEKMHKSLERKARSIPIGAAGLFYCAETASLTTPFLIYSQPHPSNIVNNVWPERWAFPFRIHTLGTPHRQLPKDDARKILEVVRTHPSGNISHALHLSPVQVLVPVEIDTADWGLIIEALV